MSSLLELMGDVRRQIFEACRIPEARLTATMPPLSPPPPLRQFIADTWEVDGRGSLKIRLRGLFPAPPSVPVVYYGQVGSMMPAVVVPSVTLWFDLRTAPEEVLALTRGCYEAATLTEDRLGALIQTAQRWETEHWSPRRFVVDGLEIDAGFGTGAGGNGTYTINGRIEVAAAEVNAAATERSIDLLKRWLSPEQLAEYEKSESFRVLGSCGGRYRIRRARTFNIDDLDGSLQLQLCLVPVGCPHVGDIMLAQKIALETDEARAVRDANRRFMTDYAQFLQAEPDRATSENASSPNGA